MFSVFPFVHVFSSVAHHIDVRSLFAIFHIKRMSGAGERSATITRCFFFFSLQVDLPLGAHFDWFCGSRHFSGCALSCLKCALDAATSRRGEQIWRIGIHCPLTIRHTMLDILWMEWTGELCPNAQLDTSTRRWPSFALVFHFNVGIMLLHRLVLYLYIFCFGSVRDDRQYISQIFNSHRYLFVPSEELNGVVFDSTHCCFGDLYAFLRLSHCRFRHCTIATIATKSFCI